MVDNNPLEAVEWETLGMAIRERRLARDLTLVELAGQVELSQPFLSQVENGRARPSMVSLYRIAHALGTTPQAFFGGPSEGASAPALVRAEQVRAVDVTGDGSDSICHLLLAGDAPFHVLEFVGLPTEFTEYWEHDGFEALYIVEGNIEIDVSGTISPLSQGDFLSYPSRLPHRLRSVDGGPARVLLIETKVEALQDRRPGSHVPVTPVRKRVRRPAKRSAINASTVRKSGGAIQ